jgi:hypothetical protein
VHLLEHVRGQRDFKELPPAYLREGGDMNKPVEVRVRTTIHSLRNVDLVKQCFTCQFFLEGAPPFIAPHAPR